MSVVVTRREMVAWALAVVLAVTVVVTVRPDGADAGANGPTTDVVFVASGEASPDGFSAAPAAALGIGPVLLVQFDSVPPETLAELNRLEPSEIFIVGGTAVVSDGVKTTLEGLSFSPTVTRLAGVNRFATAAEVSEAVFPHVGFLGADDTAADSELLDGMDSSEFLGSGDTAADAELLDGKDSTEFLGSDDKAADSELLDGKDSSAFVETTDLVAAHASDDEEIEATVTDLDDVVVLAVALTAPSNGVVVVNSTVSVAEATQGDELRCSITTNTTLDTDFLQVWESPGFDGRLAQLAGTRGFDVTAGEFTANLVCDHEGSSISWGLLDRALTAIFIPDS